MYIKLIYRNYCKKLVWKEDFSRYENLEQITKKSFDIFGKHILLYYVDADEEKIVLLEDKDIQGMKDSLCDKKVFYEIHVRIAEDVLFDFQNIELLKRSYLVQLKRRHLERESPDKRELQQDLQAIREYLIKNGLEENFTDKLVEHLGLQMGLLIMDRFMSKELENFDQHFDDQMQNLMHQISELSVSSINNPSSHSNFSFATRSDHKILSGELNDSLLSLSDSQLSEDPSTFNEQNAEAKAHDYYQPNPSPKPKPESATHSMISLKSHTGLPEGLKKDGSSLTRSNPFTEANSSEMLGNFGKLFKGIKSRLRLGTCSRMAN